ncbi:Chitin synthase, class 3 [Mucor velutinosus]|uniref:Chitin synthase, class 3 n=1 Tax=Mucor velutinosus TaxID=708070 RepID=A0AAN7DQ25_9FUNG|nr:Chitin synthase, class 3 [Mucor velutinosus]
MNQNQVLPDGTSSKKFNIWHAITERAKQKLQKNHDKKHRQPTDMLVVKACFKFIDNFYRRLFKSKK